MIQTIAHCTETFVNLLAANDEYTLFVAWMKFFMGNETRLQICWTFWNISGLVFFYIISKYFIAININHYYYL